MTMVSTTSLWGLLGNEQADEILHRNHPASASGFISRHYVRRWRIVWLKPLVGQVPSQDHVHSYQRLHLVTYVAALDVPRHIVEQLARLLTAHRRRICSPRRSRALGPSGQAVLVLRWFRERGCVHRLARDAGISQATGYRYLHEAISVLAEQAPDLHTVLEYCRDRQMTHVILEGTLIRSDCVAGLRDNGNDLWFG